MRTIEERAVEYAKEGLLQAQKQITDERTKSYAQGRSIGELCGYRAGALDQHKIDIDAACAWWKERCKRDGITAYAVELFRKAMEATIQEED